MSPTIFGLIIFLISVLASRQLSEQAFNVLNDNQKLSVIKGFTGMRKYSLMPILVIVLIVLGVPLIAGEFRSASSLAGLVLLTIYLGVMHVLIRRRLRDLKMPNEFDRKYLISRHVNHLGILFLFLCAFWEMSLKAAQ